ncbi:MAG: hypothetical protein PHI12_08045 [Dehalococcoidales bacterium]|jgi:hypothetical protein|nr:hypothetical protein [Dehalococcoidales bacterium]
MGRLINAAKALRAGIRNARIALLPSTSGQGCVRCRYHGQAAVSKEYDTGLSIGDVDVDRG